MSSLFRLSLPLLVLLACAPAVEVGDEPTSDSASAAVEPKKPQSVEIPKTLTRPTYACAKSAGQSPEASRTDQVCWRWHCDGDAKAPATWDGNAATCKAGDLDEDAAEVALRRINVHRFLADLEPFAQESGWTRASQECALLAEANEKLSHEPPESWACWSKMGANASYWSLVANVSLVPSIAAYFEDPGNETTMVHRRWLLDETLASVGFGTTDRYSCVMVDGRSVSKRTVKPKDKRGWSAWPPAGVVPFDVFETEKLDTAGWTVQSTGNDLEDATVTVSSEGRDLPVMVNRLTVGQGSRTAIRFVPQGWTTQAGRTYAVAVKGSAGTFEFDVNPIDCTR